MGKERKKVVIAGAGFAGIFAARTLFGKNVDVTIIDRNNYHTFNPLLYQVGSGELEPSEIAYPVRSVIRFRRGVSFFMAEIESLNTGEKILVTDRGEIPYDYLILATGSSPTYYGIRGADKYALNLNTLDDSLKLRNHILRQFEKASLCSDPKEVERLLTFVIIGGGPTGVEFAGAFAELIQGPLHKDFPELYISLMNIILIDAAPRLLAGFGDKVAAYTERKLEEMGVKVILNSPVKQIRKGAVVASDGRVLRSNTILWTAGVSGDDIPSDIKLSSRKDSRVSVTDTLQHPDADNIFVCGDMAYLQKEGKPYPMMAPVATQQGIHAAKNILRIIRGKKAVPFRFSDRGAMVTIGRNSAVARIGSFEVKGFFAWALWLIIHIFFLIGFRNKIFVIINWFWDYIFFERSGRMIIPSCDDDGK